MDDSELNSQLKPAGSNVLQSNSFSSTSPLLHVVFINFGNISKEPVASFDTDYKKNSREAPHTQRRLTF